MEFLKIEKSSHLEFWYVSDSVRPMNLLKFQLKKVMLKSILKRGGQCTFPTFNRRPRCTPSFLGLCVRALPVSSFRALHHHSFKFLPAYKLKLGLPSSVLFSLFRFLGVTRNMHRGTDYFHIANWVIFTRPCLSRAVLLSGAKQYNLLPGIVFFLSFIAFLKWEPTQAFNAPWVTMLTAQRCVR